jgi:UDPglucose 6-dehydrogenase
MQQAKAVLSDKVTYCDDALSAATGVDALLLLTEWNEFRAINPAKLLAVMQGAVFIDLRNVYDPAAMRQAGFVYHSVGRP